MFLVLIEKTYDGYLQVTRVVEGKHNGGTFKVENTGDVPIRRFIEEFRIGKYNQSKAGG